MEDWLKIPKDRARVPALRLCLILGLTVLLYLVVAPQVFAAIILNMTLFSG